jgi:hypothetical protein
MLLAALLPAAYACHHAAIDSPPDRVPIDGKMLIGTWQLTSQEARYSSATFRPDSKVVLGCRLCDTVFYYGYAVTDSSLIFTSLQTGEAIANDVVESLTQDTLVFRTLLSHHWQQSYHR